MICIEIQKTFYLAETDCKNASVSVGKHCIVCRIASQTGIYRLFGRFMNHNLAYLIVYVLIVTAKLCLMSLYRLFIYLSLFWGKFKRSATSPTTIPVEYLVIYHKFEITVWCRSAERIWFSFGGQESYPSRPWSE